MADYDHFVECYDELWSHHSLDFLTRYEELVFSRTEGSLRILDACCGTGRFSQALAEKGHSVTGVDQSPVMIEYARRNAPLASFQVADIRHLDNLHGDYDCVVSVFDSLNHLLTKQELLSAFKSISASLKSHGTFAFDMNTSEKYVKHWTNEFGVEYNGKKAQVRSDIDEQRKLASFEFTPSQHDEDHASNRVTLLQTWWTTTELQEVLKQSGFCNLQITPLQCDSDGCALRNLFVASKSTSTSR